MLHSYDIFAERYGDAGARWIQSVEGGLDSANERTNEIAAKTDGPYFVSDAHLKEVLASVDTSEVETRAAK